MLFNKCLKQCALLMMALVTFNSFICTHSYAQAQSLNSDTPSSATSSTQNNKNTDLKRLKAIIDRGFVHLHDDMAYSDEFFTLDLGAELTKKISLDTIDQMQSESFANLFLPFQYKSYKDISSSVCHNKLLDKIRLIYKKSFFPLNEDASLFFTSEDTQCDLASGDTRDMINTLSQMQITKVYKALMLLKLRADAANYDNLVIDHQFCFCEITQMRDLITDMEGAETKALPLLTQLKLSDPGNQYIDIAIQQLKSYPNLEKMEIDKKTIDELAFILKYFRSGLENIIDAMKYGAAGLAGYEVLNHSETPKVTENKSENSSKIEQKLNQMISIESLLLPNYIMPGTDIAKYAGSFLDEIANSLQADTALNPTVPFRYFCKGNYKLMDTYENYVPQEAELYSKHDRIMAADYYSRRRKGVDSDIDDRQVYTPDEIKNNIFDEAVTDMGLTLLITKKDKDKNISCDTYNKQQKINLLLKFKKKYKKEVSDHYIKPALLAISNLYYLYYKKIDQSGAYSPKPNPANAQDVFYNTYLELMKAVPDSPNSYKNDVHSKTFRLYYDWVKKINETKKIGDLKHQAIFLLNEYHMKQKSINILKERFMMIYSILNQLETKNSKLFKGVINQRQSYQNDNQQLGMVTSDPEKAAQNDGDAAQRTTDNLKSSDKPAKAGMDAGGDAF